MLRVSLLPSSAGTAARTCAKKTKLWPPSIWCICIVLGTTVQKIFSVFCLSSCYWGVNILLKTFLTVFWQIQFQIGIFYWIRWCRCYDILGFFLNIPIFTISFLCINTTALEPPWKKVSGFLPWCLKKALIISLLFCRFKFLYLNRLQSRIFFQIIYKQATG